MPDQPRASVDPKRMISTNHGPVTPTCKNGRMDAQHGSAIDITYTGPGSAFEHILTQKFVAGEFSHIQNFSLTSPAPWGDVFSAFTHEDTGIVQTSASSWSHGQRAMLARETDEGRSMAALGRDSDGEWHLTVVADSAEETQRWVAALSSMLPPIPESLDEERLAVDFWAQHPMSGGASARTRYIVAPGYDEIASNYPPEVHAQVEQVMNLQQPDGLGKLMLFHGPPGTGKTRSILSLFRAWDAWCDLSVVTDPERLAGDATYLNDLLFSVSNDKNWLLLVIEDGDTFVNVDSRESKGESIGRLLNVADGIMGQGLNVLTLISTNVKVEKLNDAMSRPGRCMANIYFRPFTAGESLDWLATQLDDKAVAAERLQLLAEGKYGGAFSEKEQEDLTSFTLAELYAALR